MTQLPGVNDNKIAAGFYVDAGGNAQDFLYNILTKAFTPVTLPGSFTAMMTTVTDVSDNGIISGFYVDGAGNTHGFIDDGGTFTSLDDPKTNGNTMFLGLNNAGMVVGSFVDENNLTNGLVYNLLSNTWQTVDDPNASAKVAFASMERP